ncbi:MAG: TraB/GumN family protein [Proteobacteria bacterium]|nr:TraB/GumN family protein [Pseudomonadota bacterium]
MNIRYRWLALVLCAAFLVNLPARADDTLEEVLVTGHQPGPGLWKVTRAGDPHGHVLWILGNHSPLPKRMTWRSAELAEVLAVSQAVLAPVSVSASAGPLGGITLLPSLIGVRSNPDDKRLQEVVPADLYARWLPLKARYLGKDAGVEDWRPIFAAQELYRAALKKNDLVPYDGVWPAVEKLARKARVPITVPAIELKVVKARAAIKEFKSTPFADVECFSRTLQRLESDLDLMRERANAWAVGDVARLRQLAPIERASACIGVMLESSFMQQRGFGDVLERARNAWLTAAEKSLASNESTVAVLSVDEILKPDGYVAQLKNRGYVVADP